MIIGCTTDLNVDGYYEFSEEFLNNTKVSILHKNPNTGLDYTQEELDMLTYDPSEKESYLEGQDVVLTLVTINMPSEVKVVGADLSVLETITEFTMVDGKYHAKSFESTLEDLGLLEADDTNKLTFKITYPAGPPISISFQVKRIEPNAGEDFFVYLKNSTGETIGLLTDDDVALRVKDPEVGSILTFEGASNKVEILDAHGSLDFRNTQNYSIGIWVNTTSSNNDPAIISDKDWGSGGNPGFVIVYKGGVWGLNASDGSSRIDLEGSAINDGNWHFLMATFDRSGNASIYKDGVLEGAADISGLGDMTSGYPIRIGQDGTGNYGVPFNGNIGNAYIYDYALSASEIQSISTVTTGVQLRTAAGTTSNVAVTNNGGVVSLEENRYTYSFDGTTSATLEDGADLSFRYDGDFSIATWVNTTATNSDPAIISDKDWGSGGNKGFVLIFKGSVWGMNAGDGNGNRIDMEGTEINDGEWHFIVATFDRNGNATIYQDGEKVGETNMSALGNMDSGFPIRLAQDGTDNYGHFFNGKVANSMIFDYVLSPVEVTSLYNE
ncbi:hypothetical protein GCM10022395_35810 [Snuella lapsa]|uniref:LamG domain-containing protein n=2 Tax=Snuella lapsa TaxID=870481 RepID=A0ABP6YK78_9FLAO